jgi:hypothetical protein
VSVEQMTGGLRLAQRARVERGLTDATTTLHERRAALRRAGECMRLRPEQGDIVEVADAAMAYQAALDRVRFFQDELRRLNPPES